MKRGFVTFGIFILTFGIVYGSIAGVFELFSGRSNATFDINTVLERENKINIPQKWLDKYNVVAKNDIDAKIDHDDDGLTLIEEYEYGTHPKKADTDGDGYTDGQEVQNGYSPSGDGLMDQNRNEVPDMWEISKLGYIDEDDEDDHDGDGLMLSDEYKYGTHPKKADTDGDGYTDGQEVQNGYDPGAPGDARIKMTLIIDKINVEVPVVLSKNTDEPSIQKDLEKGVVHYPGTSLPGQRGNVYIAGHSSNYAWSNGLYNYVFKNLNNLNSGDEIRIIARLHNGNEIEYTYTVNLNEEVAPDDRRIFADTQSQELTLTTCWPLGTSARRLMVKAHLQDA